MKNRFIFLILTIFSLAAIVNAAENNYVITLERANTELSLLDLKFAEGSGPDYIDQPEEGYMARMLSFKGEEMLRFNFSVNEPIIIEQFSDLNLTPQEVENIQNPPTEKIYLNFPDYPNAKKIEILDETGELKLDIDLSSYARCNENGFCDFNEDLQKCPEDCRKEIARPEVKADEAKKEEAIEEIPAALEEPKEETLLEQLEEKGISRNLIIIIAVLALILVIIIILARKKKE